MQMLFLPPMLTVQAPLSNRRADGEVVGLLAPSAPFPTTLDASPNPIAPSLCGVFSVAFYRQVSFFRQNFCA